MPLYAVEIKTVAIVYAEDAREAEEIANDQRRDIIADCGLIVETKRVINRLDDLRICNHSPHPPYEVDLPWDGDCFPYGNAHQRIKELVPIKDDEEN